MHVALRLLQRGDNVVGIDNLNDYYGPQLSVTASISKKSFQVLFLRTWI